MFSNTSIFYSFDYFFYISNKKFQFSDNTRLAFGDMVSTSNTYNEEPFVTVTTDGFITWSMGIDPIL